MTLRFDAENRAIRVRVRVCEQRAPSANEKLRQKPGADVLHREPQKIQACEYLEMRYCAQQGRGA